MTILPSLSLLKKINQFIQGEKFSLNCGLFLLSWKSGLRVSEAISFDYSLKHPRYKDLYLVKGKGNKTRYVYVSREIVQELKSNHWKPNQTNRFAFNGFLKKVKEKLNIPSNVELTPHTLRRCFTTHNALSGVPLPILQKALGHANIRTTSGYWKGSVDIREFSEWLEPDSSPREPEEVPRVEVIPKSPKVAEITNQPKITLSASPLLEKDLMIAEKDKQLKSKDSKISLLTNENEKLKIISQEKDKQLAKCKEKLKEITNKNNQLIENYKGLKNIAKSKGEIKANSNKIQTKPPQEKNIRKILLNSEENLPNTLLEIKKPKNNSLATKEKPQTELMAQIQVWKPPN